MKYIRILNHFRITEPLDKGYSSTRKSAITKSETKPSRVHRKFFIVLLKFSDMEILIINAGTDELPPVIEINGKKFVKIAFIPYYAR